MIPILFDKNATEFSSHGLGDLMDCASCEVNQTEEGVFEGELLYPYSGVLFDLLIMDNIIVVKPNPYDKNQAFRIYGINKNIDGSVNVKFQHISYDLNYYASTIYPTGPTIRSTSAAVFKLKENEVVKSPFTYDGYHGGTSFHYGNSTSQNYIRSDYASVRDILLNGDNSIKNFFGNDVFFDNYTVTLREIAGQDRGVCINYGVNLTDLQQEENLSSYYNGIVPYWFGKDPRRPDGYYTDLQGEFVVGPVLYAHPYETPYSEKYVSTVPPEGELSKLMALDLTEYFTSLAKVRPPTASELEEIGRSWVSHSTLGIPEINITLDYVDDGSDIRLNDAITVRFPKLNIRAKAKVVSYTYDVLQERYTEIELGTAKAQTAWKNLADEKRFARSAYYPRMSRYVYGTFA